MYQEFGLSQRPKKQFIFHLYRRTNEKKCKPYLDVKENHDVMYLIDPKTAQESFDFDQTANGSVLCYDTVPAEFLTMIVNLKDGSPRFVQNATNGSPPKNRKTRTQQRKYFVEYWNGNYIHCRIDSTARGNSLHFRWSK